MLLLFLALMILTLVRGAKACKQQKSWLRDSMFIAVLFYLIIMLIGTSSVTIAPIFWMLAGICISFYEPKQN